MITKKQKEVLDFIKKYKGKKKYAPSLEEIRKHFRLASVSTAHHYIRALDDAGYLNKEDNQPRSIDIIDDEQMRRVPLSGTIAAGFPIKAIEEYETIQVPKKMLARSGDHFALRVAGDSMIGEGIFDGDTVIIRKQNTAENGETVVALLDDNEATLKKIYRVPGGFKLQPANPTIPAFTVKQLVVQGKVISVMRNYESKKNLLDAINLTNFSDSLKQLVERTLREIKEDFEPNAEFEIWKQTENVSSQEKFCLETTYTFLNELLLLWICKDKKLLKFEIIQDKHELSTLKKEAQKIYSHIFENNIFDWYDPGSLLLQEIANSFNKYDFTRIDRDILGKLYEQFITREERKKLGQFYTPEPVIDYILDQIGYTNNIEDKQIIDISCGSGGFITRAAGRLINKLKENKNKESIIAKVINNIYGLDINPFACYLAETNILIQLLDLIVETKQENPRYEVPKINIYQTNSIEIPLLLSTEEQNIKHIKNKTGKFANGFDFVVGNPPYLEAKKMDRHTKQLCKNSFPDIAAGSFDLFICFIKKGLDILKNNNGKFGYIIPNKFLIANYAKKMRAELLDRYTIREIIDVSECEVFENVSVYPVIVIVENKIPRNNTVKTAEKITHIEELPKKTFVANGIKQNIYKRDDLIFFILPNDKKQSSLLMKLLDEKYRTLDNYLDIRWTISFHASGLREKFLFPEKPHLEFSKKLIGGKSFAGNSDIDRYKLTWGGWWIDYNEELAKKHKNQLPPKKIFEQEKIIICQNALRLRAAFDNQNYYCKDTFFVANLVREKKDCSLKFFLAILNSKLMHFYYANIYKGTHISGGYLHYLIGYLNSLLIALPTKKQHNKVVSLVDNILKCKNKKEFEFLDKKIDKEIYKIYNLSESETKIIDGFI